MSLNKVAFLDRDGVINEDKGYVHLWKDFEFCKGSIVGLKNLIDLKFKLVIITNQSGIDRGIFSEKQFFTLTNLMINELLKNNINIAGVYHCPHHPEFSKSEFKNCTCRKPKPGLFLKAIKDFNASLDDSIAIGDNERDLVAAKLAGIKNRYLISKNYNNKYNKDIFTRTHNSLLECTNSLNVFDETFS